MSWINSLPVWNPKPKHLIVNRRQRRLFNRKIEKLNKDIQTIEEMFLHQLFHPYTNLSYLDIYNHYLDMFVKYLDYHVVHKGVNANLQYDYFQLKYGPIKS